MIRRSVGIVTCFVLVTALGFRSGSVSTRGPSRFDDCRRRRKPLRPGEFALDGIWLDHRNNHKVRIKQSGSNYNQTAQLWAYYVDPVECSYPNGELPEDFFGDLQNNKLTGEIYLCSQVPESASFFPPGCKRKSRVSWLTSGALVVGNVNQITCAVDGAVCGKHYQRKKEEKNEKGACQDFYASVKASLPKQEVCCDCYPNCGFTKPEAGTAKPSPKLELTVAADGKSMSGTYLNPYPYGPVQIITPAGPATEETITLTLEKSLTPFGGDNRGSYDDDWVTYYPNTVMTATSGTKIYADASSSSGVKMTLPAGTQMVMEHVILGSDGQPAWYYVTDKSSVGGTKWNGFVPAPMVRCPGVDQNRSSS